MGMNLGKHTVTMGQLTMSLQIMSFSNCKDTCGPGQYKSSLLKKCEYVCVYVCVCVWGGGGGNTLAILEKLFFLHYIVLLVWLQVSSQDLLLGALLAAPAGIALSKLNAPEVYQTLFPRTKDTEEDR